MKFLCFLFFFSLVVAIVSGAEDLSRYKRAGPFAPKVCRPGDVLHRGVCLGKCPPKSSVLSSDITRCVEDCSPGDTAVGKMKCRSKSCPTGYFLRSGTCYAKTCPKGYSPSGNASDIKCYKNCRGGYKPGPNKKCVAVSPKEGACESYPRETCSRATKARVIYTKKIVPRPTYQPNCEKGFRMDAKKKECWEKCRDQYVPLGNLCVFGKCADRRTAKVVDHSGRTHSVTVIRGAKSQKVYEGPVGKVTKKCPYSRGVTYVQMDNDGNLRVVYRPRCSEKLQHFKGKVFGNWIPPNGIGVSTAAYKSKKATAQFTW